jgi:hypothetical protein
MQSEFSCHIGLRGKLFCRGCWVKGSDALEGLRATSKINEDAPDMPPADISPIASDNDSDSNFHGSSTLGRISASSPSVSMSKTKKAKETMEAMLKRVTSFVKALVLVNIDSSFC